MDAAVAQVSGRHRHGACVCGRCAQGFGVVSVRAHVAVCEIAGPWRVRLLGGPGPGGEAGGA